MGYQALKELWKRRGEYDIVVLLRPSAKNKELLRGYEEEAGVPPVPGKGVSEGDGVKVV